MGLRSWEFQNETSLTSQPTWNMFCSTARRCLPRLLDSLDQCQLPGASSLHRRAPQVVVRWESSTSQSHEIPDNFASTFKQLGVTASLVRALNSQGIVSPTPIQAEALPITLAHHEKNCIVQSETGTGKTLTFLLPALQDRASGLSTMILVPTRELAVQMHHQAVTLAGRRKDSRRVLSAFSGTECHKDEDLVTARPHVLIGTPKKVLEMVETNMKDFVTVRRIVLDEVDKLLLVSSGRETKKKRMTREIHPRAASEIVRKILSYSQLKRKGDVQLICASATVNQKLQQELWELGWGASPALISTTAHRLTLPMGIKHEYVMCSKPNQNNDQRDILDVSISKLDSLVKHFCLSGEKSALVFIHRGASISEYVHMLNSRGINATALYGKMLDLSKYPAFIEDFKSGKIQMAIGTEETVRGLDFLWLGTVYLLEVPRTAQEYLHLCGRVGRLGKSGRAVVFVDGQSEESRIARQYKALGVEDVYRIDM